MNIGEASKVSGVSAKMIRYYEKIGLIEAAERSASGYRHYDENDVHTLGFIARSRDLGFSVEQIAELLALWRDRSRASAQVKEMALAHVEELKRKVVSLQGMVRTLSTLANDCCGDNRPDCPIIDDLASSRRSAKTPMRVTGVDHRFQAGDAKGVARKGKHRGFNSVGS
jgi:MerR family copper efflux transcriptional regulator